MVCVSIKIVLSILKIKFYLFNVVGIIKFWIYFWVVVIVWVIFIMVWVVSNIIINIKGIC